MYCDYRNIVFEGLLHLTGDVAQVRRIHLVEGSCSVLRYTNIGCNGRDQLGCLHKRQYIDERTEGGTCPFCWRYICWVLVVIAIRVSRLYFYGVRLRD